MLLLIVTGVLLRWFESDLAKLHCSTNDIISACPIGKLGVLTA